MSGRADLADDGLRAEVRGGSVGYAAPEHRPGQAVTPASDVFSLAIVLVEIATGLMPLDVERWDGTDRRDFQRLLESRLNRKPSGWRSWLNRNHAADLAAVLMKALSGDPKARYADVGDFAGRLEDVLAGIPIPERRQPLRMTLHRAASRPARSILATVAICAVLTGAMALDRHARLHRIAATIEGLLQNAERQVEALTRGSGPDVRAWESAETPLVKAGSLLGEDVPGGSALRLRLEDLAETVRRGRAKAAEDMTRDGHRRRMPEYLREARFAPVESLSASFDYDDAAGDRAFARAFADFLGDDILTSTRREELRAIMIASPLRAELAVGLSQWMFLRMKAAVVSLRSRLIVAAMAECQILREEALAVGESGDEWERRFYGAFGSPLAAYITSAWKILMQWAVGPLSG